jgi:hypothetical protein
MEYKSLTVFRDPDDKKFYKETDFYHALKKHLNANGHDLIKKIMCKDGHMCGDENGPYYLRDRKWRYCFFDGKYAIRQIHHDYNEGKAELLIEYWEEAK